MPEPRLFGAQREALQKALMSALFNRDELEQFLLFRLEKNLEEIARPGALPKVMFDVIQMAEAEGWTDDLIRKAVAYRPGNPALKLFWAQYQGSAQREVERAAATQGLQLERVVSALNGFQDVRAWRQRLQEVTARVCRIELYGPATPVGTGFLVGDDLVLTNHHVFTRLWRGDAVPSDVIVRFDHYYEPDGLALSPGTEHRLHADWCVASSPPSPLDSQPEALDAPGVDALDYALVRLAKPAAKDIIEGNERGRLPYRRGAVELREKMGVIIVQHPGGKPMKLAIDSEALLPLRPGNTRVRYRTSTEAGSSGSPVFSMAWELFALHHSGNPEQDARYNEGIPLDTIRDQLPDAARAALGW